jgi:hypothetical protein
VSDRPLTGDFVGKILYLCGENWQKLRIFVVLFGKMIDFIGQTTHTIIE